LLDSLLQEINYHDLYRGVMCEDSGLVLACRLREKVCRMSLQAG